MVTTLDHLKNQDEVGPIEFKIGIQSGEVVLDFGRPLNWISFTPKMADDVAKLLIEKANIIRETKKNERKNSKRKN